jgi:hypothetical protein
MSWLGNLWDDLTGQTAAEEMSAASTQGSEANLAFQREALDYMKQQNAPMTQMRDTAMGQMGGLMGLTGYDQGGAMQSLERNPMYQSQLANIDQQQASAMDTMGAMAASTGGFRGGNMQRGIMESSFNADRAKQDALSNVYSQQMAGLGGLAGLNTGTGQIASQMQNMGNITGQGIIGAAQSGQAAQQAGFGNMLGLGGLGIGLAGLFSDERLKDNVVRVGRKNGLPWYSWTWNSKGNSVGEYGEAQGHLAGEVEAKYPNAVYIDENSGYKKVNYGVLNNG